MDVKRLAIPVVGAALIGGAIAGIGLTAFAASGSPPATAETVSGTKAPMGAGFGQGVSGTVTAVNGSTITVTGANGGVYTVDASSASVEKYANGTSSSVGVAGIAVGDTVMINGTIETATISAKDIRDGVPPKPVAPVAAGKVTAVAGSTITLSGMTRGTTAGAKPTATTYTVDASSATITKITPSTTKGTKPTTSTISVSGIAVGDMLTVQGTADGSSITATAITDGSSFGGGFGGRGFGGPAPAQQ